MSQQQSTFGEAEKKAAERYLWWPIYLVREKRRLAGITEAVRAGAVDAGHHAPLPTPEVLPGESAEQFLLRAEQQGEAAFPDPLTIFDSHGEDQNGATEEDPVPEPEVSFAPPDLEASLEAQETDAATAGPASYELKKTSPGEGLEQAFKLPIADDTNSLW